MITIRRWEASDRFVKDLKSAPEEVRRATKDALKLLLNEPIPKALRLHRLSGMPKPAIWKIDIYANHSWQITFEVDGNKAILKRLGTHKAIDRSPR